MALIQLTFRSQVLGYDTNVRVVLPKDPGGAFPTLYLLHGMGGDSSSWVRFSPLEYIAREKNIAIVCPETHNGWYVNHPSGPQYLTYLTEELPAFCQATFGGMSAKREENFIAGLSMGGYGAFRAALECPEKYAKAVSLSGALDLAQRVDSADAYQRYIFGDAAHFLGSDNDLPALAKRRLQEGRELPEMMLACGWDDYLLTHSQSFEKTMREAGQEIRCIYDEGAHNWDFWGKMLPQMLEFLSE